MLFDISVLRFAEPYSGPVLAALAREGVDVVVTDDGMVRQLGERRRAEGDEQLRIELLEGLAAEQPPAGARRVAFVEGPRRRGGSRARPPGDRGDRPRLPRRPAAVARRTRRGEGRTDRRGRRGPRAGRRCHRVGDERAAGRPRDERLRRARPVDRGDVPALRRAAAAARPRRRSDCSSCRSPRADGSRRSPSARPGTAARARRCERAMRNRSAAARVALRGPSLVPPMSRHSFSGTSRKADAGSPATSAVPWWSRPRSSTSNTQRLVNGCASAALSGGPSRNTLAPHCVS